MSRLWTIPCFVFGFGCAQPKTGEFAFTIDSTNTDCPEVDALPGAEIEHGSVAITVADDGTELAFGEVNCPIDGQSFTCVLRDDTTDYASSGTNAVVSVFVGFEGRWKSSARIAGTRTTEVDCTGADCASLEQAGIVPCTATVTSTGQRQ